MEKAKATKIAGGIPEGWAKASSGLTPFIILGINEHLHGKLTRVEVREETEARKGKRASVKERTFYEFMLLTSTETRGVKGNQTRRYSEGELVLLPGSGVLDSEFLRIAKALGHFDASTEEADWSGLEGLEARVSRLEDGKISKGPYKGNKMKLYEVLYRPDSVAVVEPRRPSGKKSKRAA